MTPRHENAPTRGSGKIRWGGRRGGEKWRAKRDVARGRGQRRRRPMPRRETFARSANRDAEARHLHNLCKCMRGAAKRSKAALIHVPGCHVLGNALWRLVFDVTRDETMFQLKVKQNSLQILSRSKRRRSPLSPAPFLCLLGTNAEKKCL